MAQWQEFVTGSGPPDEAVTRWALERLAGAAHRFVWVGDTEHGERGHCMAWFADAVRQAYAAGGRARALAQVIDWWLAATTGRDVVGAAWQIEHILPGALGAAMRGVLDHQGADPALVALRRPVAFAAARDALEALLDPRKIPHLKVAPAPTLYGEARSEAMHVLQAARQGQSAAPTDLRLLDEDVEVWASEVRVGKQLLTKVKVWHPLVRAMSALQDHVRALVDRWTTGRPPQTPLPPGWRRGLEDALGDAAPVALALVGDLDWNVNGPRPLLDAADALRALRAADGLAEPVWVRMLPLSREAQAAAPDQPAPAWAAGAERTLDALRQQVQSLRARARGRGIPDAQASLREATERLDAFDVVKASEWVRLARDFIRTDEQNVEREDLFDRAAELYTALSRASLLPTDAPIAEPAVVGGPAAELDALTAWHERLIAAHAEAQERLGGELVELRTQADRLPPSERTAAAGRLRNAAEALPRSLVLGRQALGEAREAIKALARNVEARLTPRLREALDRVNAHRGLYPEERRSLQLLIDRIARRAEIELAFDGQLQGLEALLAALDADAPFREPVLGVVAEGAGPGGLAIVPVCWLTTGVTFAPVRVPGELLLTPPGVEMVAGALVVVRPEHVPEGGPLAGALRLEEAPDPLTSGLLADLIERPDPEAPWDAVDFGHLPDPSDALFVEVDGHVLGPSRLNVEGRLVPAERSFEAKLAREAFDPLFGRIEVSLPGRRRRVLVHGPPDLQTLVDLGATPVDRLPPGEADHWLARLVEGLDEVDPERLSVLALELDALPDELRRERMGRLSALIETSRWLVKERKRAAERFLATDEGRREVARAAERYAERARAEIDREIEVLRADAGSERARLEVEIEGLRTAEVDERHRLERALATLRDEVDALESLRGDTRTRLLAELFGDGRANAGVGARPQGSVARQAPLSATFDPLRPAASIAAVGAELAPRMSGWEPHDVQNLLLTVLTSPWTLLAGPPGVGKSTLARDVLGQLGAHRDSDRYRELVVRRDWHDDTALFGYWHPQRDEWMPSTDGLVELLLRAEHAAREGHGALFAVLLEELNLASPEHYLSRVISALEDRAPVVHLYDEGLAPANAGRYPSRVRLGSNVRLVGTVNVDDTVERLSPRFLSRSAVVWVEPALEQLLHPPPKAPLAAEALDWAALVAHVGRLPRPDLGPLIEVFELLLKHRVDGAPTPRTVRGVEAYLAASDGLLPRRVAEDYCLSQRVLPGLRGVGEHVGESFEQLARLLRRQGWERSAARCERMRERGALAGHFYDFFHG